MKQNAWKREQCRAAEHAQASLENAGDVTIPSVAQLQVLIQINEC
jgi:hypothetical protein